MEKITLSYIALALKKQYVPGKVILKWIRDYRINLAISGRYTIQQVLMLRDLEGQALRLKEKQSVKEMMKIMRKDMEWR
ncbi:hypothetical protein NM952_10935 [Pasteurella multocida subsp. multocida]|uniref:Uncharacterized protein n=1 Tax=Pasteurella multocida TaxID=747 RepID=A0A9X3USI2_PASMD|nr:hypothetical protein [Pasteurella multocida]AUK50051.1 hypothetical protein A4210_10060 [Pasteurella multocida]AUK50222.1 hypothetical protein A4210_11040 [Pasteurella multocida]AUK54665.1 hypothetical protein A4204_10065 [Pasteurella multocida]EPE64907.1 hypothetical protein I141_10790 [Pasteurella multocida P1933]ESQ72737.1 hypothetical protein P1062_0204150 [Pasteurella multocida subsp. multocida P1062]